MEGHTESTHQILRSSSTKWVKIWFTAEGHKHELSNESFIYRALDTRA